LDGDRTDGGKCRCRQTDPCKWTCKSHVSHKVDEWYIMCKAHASHMTDLWK